MCRLFREEGRQDSPASSLGGSLMRQAFLEQVSGEAVVTEGERTVTETERSQ